MIDLASLESYVQHEITKHNVPGFALAIVEGAEITYARGFGVTSVEHPGIPVTPETIFCCGSISKSLTAATVMRLVERGMVDLDEPVVTYVPRLTFSHEEFSEGVTLRRLLSHSSGLAGTGANFGPRDLPDLERFIRETVPHLDFVATPGLVFDYSSLGIDLAGYVVEVVTGKYFPEVVRELLLDPLDMTRTTYDRTVTMTYDVALPHYTGEDGRPRVQHRMFDYAAANPAGQAMTSTRDLAHFVIALLDGGRFRGRQVIAEDLVREMITPQIPLHDGRGGGYGLGLYTLQQEGRRWITHGGFLTPYLCEMSFLPDEGLGVVYQCSTTNGFAPHLIRRRIFDEALGNRPSSAARQAASRSLPSTKVSVRAGTYFSPATGFAVIRQQGNGLILERGGEDVHLHQISDDDFASDDRSIVVGVVLDAVTDSPHLVLEEHAYAPFTLDPPLKIPPSLLETYAGRYRFEDGDTATTWLEDGTLHLALSWLGDPYRCIPVGETKFATDAGLLQFRPDRTGSLTLVLSGGIVAERMTETGSG